MSTEGTSLISTVVRRVLPVLRLGTKLVEKVPSKDDTLAETIAKMLAIADVLYEEYRGKRSYLRDLKERFDLRDRDSEAFVRLFFGTALRSSFPQKRTAVDETTDVVEVDVGGGHRLFFRETHYNESRIESDFLHTPGLDFRALIAMLWEAYTSGIYLSVATPPCGWGRETTIAALPDAGPAQLSTLAAARLDKVVASHRLYQADGIHRAYLCIGEPGTGKSTFTVLFARQVGGKALKLDAAALPLLSVAELDFLLDALRPDVLIIDDMDRAPVETVGARVLFLLEVLKAKHPGTAIVLTCNDATKIDGALLRPGRVDSAIEFDLPTLDEREKLVGALLAPRGSYLESERAALVARIADETADLTHAYLADLCLRLRYEPVDEVLASAHRLREIAKKASGTDETSKAPEGLSGKVATLRLPS